MALEEVTTEVEVEDPRKKKKKLASMKKVEVTKTKPSTLGVRSIVNKAVNSAKDYALMDAGFKVAQIKEKENPNSEKKAPMEPVEPAPRKPMSNEELGLDRLTERKVERPILESSPKRLEEDDISMRKANNISMRKAADTTIKPKADFKEWSDKYRVLSADREKNRLSMLKALKNKEFNEKKNVKKQTPTIEGEMFGKRYTKAQMDKDNKDQNNMLISGSSDYKNGKRISPMKDRLKTMKMYHLKD
jgi:hypothetical protein